MNEETSHVPNRDELAREQCVGDWCLIVYPDLGTHMMISILKLHPFTIRIHEPHQNFDNEYKREHWLKYMVNTRFLRECGRINTKRK